MGKKTLSEKLRQIIDENSGQRKEDGHGPEVRYRFNEMEAFIGSEASCSNKEEASQILKQAEAIERRYISMNRSTLKKISSYISRTVFRKKDRANISDIYGSILRKVDAQNSKLYQIAKEIDANKENIADYRTGQVEDLSRIFEELCSLEPERDKMLDDLVAIEDVTRNPGSYSERAYISAIVARNNLLNRFDKVNDDVIRKKNMKRIRYAQIRYLDRISSYVTTFNNFVKTRADLNQSGHDVLNICKDFIQYLPKTIALYNEIEQNINILTQLSNDYSDVQGRMLQMVVDQSYRLLGSDVTKTILQGSSIG